MDLSEVKTFLRVDYDDDDIYIKLLIDVAKEYIDDAIGQYNELKAKHRLLLLTIVQALFEERSYTVENKNEKIQYILKSIVMQEQLGD